MNYISIDAEKSPEQHIKNETMSLDRKLLKLMKNYQYFGQYRQNHALFQCHLSDWKNKNTTL